MPTEDELRDMLAAQSAPNRLDASRVVRASRRRRVPQQLAAGGAGALAIATIAVFGIQTSQFGQSGGTGEAESVSAPYVADDSSGSGFSMKQLAAEQINRCGEQLAPATPSASGLELTVVSPTTGATGTDPLTATVRMTNTGSEPVRGSTFGSPALTLSREGIVLWHSNGAIDALDVVVDLAPGEWVDYTASFTPVECAPEDDALEQFRSDLPALPAGGYELSALIYFNPSVPSATTELDLVGGPRAPITLE